MSVLSAFSLLCVFACGQFVSVRVRDLGLCICVSVFFNDAMTEQSDCFLVCRSIWVCVCLCVVSLSVRVRIMVGS